MTDDELATELGFEAPWLAKVPAGLRSEICALRERRRTELRATIDRAFEKVPRLLRTPLKKVLFP
jgi:hypothetical protein